MFLSSPNVAYDIETYMIETEEADRTARRMCGLSPEEWQLLHVLPPSQANLFASESLRCVVTDPNSGASHFYPVSHALSAYSVPMNAPAHSRVPILPIFDDGVLANAVLNVSSMRSR
jgi:5'-3' exonuclease